MSVESVGRVQIIDHSPVWRVRFTGYDEKKFDLDNLRSGGATAAVINYPNLSERLLKLHRRWKSHISKDMYILEQTQNCLSVTCNLGFKLDNVIASLE